MTDLFIGSVDGCRNVNIEVTAVVEVVVCVPVQIFC